MPIRVSNPVHLTVLNPLDPGFVTKFVPSRRPAGEILQAFQIGNFGGVAFTTDPVERAMTHIRALIMTRRGERVMRPDYGSEIWDYVFEPAPHFAAAELAARLTAAINLWEPGIRIIEASPYEADADGISVAVKISFSIQGFNEVHTTVFDTEGNRIEI